MVTLVEQHRIKAGDPRFEEIDAAAFAVKNLYNPGNFTIRQSWLFGGGYNPFAQRDHLLKEAEAYRALPREVSQLVLMQLDQNWRSCFAARRVWQEAPERFLGRPRPPSYKPKQRGRFLRTYNNQAFSLWWLREGWVKPSGLDVFIGTKQTDIKQVRIMPGRDHY